MVSVDLARRLELVMRRLSMGVSVVAVALMMAGFGLTLIRYHGAAPNQPALPPAQLLTGITNDVGLWAMSLGIFLLALLPTARVALALWLFLRSRQRLDTVVSLVVLLELLFSIWLGTHR